MAEYCSAAHFCITLIDEIFQPISRILAIRFSNHADLDLNLTLKKLTETSRVLSKSSIFASLGRLTPRWPDASGPGVGHGDFGDFATSVAQAYSPLGYAITAWAIAATPGQHG